MKNKKIALIDADSLLYFSSRDTIENSITTIEERIQGIIDKTKCDYFILFLSFKKSFRHEIYSEYKANRGKQKSTLLWKNTLRSYLYEKYNAFSMENVEADDLVAYYYANTIVKPVHDMIKDIQFEKDVFEGLNYEKIEPILCSIDKDLLNSIPGKHFNYTWYLEEDDRPETLVEGYWEKTSLKDAKTFVFKQLIIGDNTDGVKGIEGKGIKYFEKINDEDLTIEKMLSCYIERYGTSHGIYEFQKNYRLLHLLNNDEDFIREVGIVPLMAHINEVNKVEF